MAQSLPYIDVSEAFDVTASPYGTLRCSVWQEAEMKRSSPELQRHNYIVKIHLQRIASRAKRLASEIRQEYGFVETRSGVMDRVMD